MEASHEHWRTPEPLLFDPRERSALASIVRHTLEEADDDSSEIEGLRILLRKLDPDAFKEIVDKDGNPLPKDNETSSAESATLH